MQHFDVIIVGGGLSGWIAANHMTQSGLKVAVFEKSGEFGGRARTTDVDGIGLNLGAHTVYRDGELALIMRELGVDVAGSVPAVGGHGIIQDKVVVLPTTARSLTAARFLGWRAKLEYARVMMAIQRSDSFASESGSFRSWVEANAADPMVRELIYTSARVATYCAEPERQAAGPVLRQLKFVLGGGNLYVDGGWETLVEGLRRRAEGQGVVGSTGRGVVRIGPSEDPSPDGASERVSYVVDLADGTRRGADQIVLAVPPAIGCQLLQGANETSLAVWRDQARPLTAACLDLALRQLPRPELGFVMGIDTPVLLTDQSRANPGKGSGPRIVHLIKYHREGDRDAEADRSQLTEAMDRLQPGWRNELLASRFLPHMTVMFDYDHTARSSPPGPRIPELPGLYVAGDWAGHGELLADAAAASARRAALALLEDRKGNAAGKVHGIGWRKAL